MRKKPASGFSLVELLIVISIIGFLSAAGLASYLNFSRAQLLNQAAEKLVSDLRLAQSLASSGQKPSLCLLAGKLSGYSLVISSPTTYYLLVECGLSENDPDAIIKEESISDSLSMSGFSEVKFNVLRQGVVFNPLGSNSLEIKGFSNQIKTITIDAGGAIKIQ